VEGVDAGHAVAQDVLDLAGLGEGGWRRQVSKGTTGVLGVPRSLPLLLLSLMQAPPTWLSAMMMAAPEVKPVITEWDRKLISHPKRSTPTP
jgi:hypothetical protein